MLTSSQLRAGRALIDMPQKQLAALSFRSVSLIRNFENERTIPHPNSVAAIQKVLEDAGVSFDLSVGNGPGVRLKK